MLILPTEDARLDPYRLIGTPLVPRAPKVPLTRTAFAAAHVVSDPLRERNPWDSRPAVDWDATLTFRTRLWDQGLHLAEAMDTAQRGMGVDWPTALDLIQRTMRAARAHPMRPASPAARAPTTRRPERSPPPTPSLPPTPNRPRRSRPRAASSSHGLARLHCAEGHPDTYAHVYRRLIDGAAQPVILHWLGDMFDPALAGYWGTSDVAKASDFVLKLIAENPGRVDGIKISLLDQRHEEQFRARLPAGVRLYTGDDFNYAPLIEGDGTHHSHALLASSPPSPRPPPRRLKPSP